MDKKTILNELKEYQVNKNPYIISKIIYDLEHDLKPIVPNVKLNNMDQVEEIYSNNEMFINDDKKSKVIHKLLISNELNNRLDFVGYRLNKHHRMEITDVARAFIIDEITTPYHQANAIPDLVKYIEKVIGKGKNRLSKYREASLDIIDINKYYNKLIQENTRTYLYQLNNGIRKIVVNLYFLHDMIDVLGKNVICYLPIEQNKPLYFVNSLGEEGLLCPVMCFDDSQIINKISTQDSNLKSINQTTKGNKDKAYKIVYQNEEYMLKQIRNIKRYNIAAYKQLYFDIFPKLKEGNLIGEKIDSKQEIYNLELKTDSNFNRVYGPYMIQYIVDKPHNIITVTKIMPEEILLKYPSELTTYKGVMVSKNSLYNKDMFKIDLLNMLDKK